jgi:hypothetical protein
MKRHFQFGGGSAEDLNTGRAGSHYRSAKQEHIALFDEGCMGPLRRPMMGISSYRFRRKET